MVAVVLAGERPGPNPLAEASGAPCKALLEVGGRAMIDTVARALLASRFVDRVVLCGPEQRLMEDSPVLDALLEDQRVRWVAPADTPSGSVRASLEPLPPEQAVLLTTADHALLTTEIVDSFVARSMDAAADLTVGVTTLGPILQLFPSMRKTRYRLRGGDWCGCNLFLLKGGRARRVPEFWGRVEALRKRPLKAARLIGWSFLVRYLLRSMTLHQATTHIGRRAGAEIRPVELDEPRAGVDVDSVDDWRIVEAHLTESDS